MNSDQDMVKRVKETIELEDKLDADQKFKNNLAALTIVLCDKFLSSENMIELWRDRKMVKFFKYVEDQGKKKGKEEGRIEGKQEEARLILKRQVKAKLKNTDKALIAAYLNQLASGENTFKVRDVTNTLKANSIKVSNPSNLMRNAEKARKLIEEVSRVGRQTKYRFTKEGEAYVRDKFPGLTKK